MANRREGKSGSDILLEFLEVAFHSILFYRDIYPKAIFCRKKKYEIPIHVSKHPDVNNYVTECLKTGQVLLEEDGIKQIALVIVTESEVPVERYCFDLEKPSVRGGGSDLYFVRTEETFRQYLLKLSVANLRKLPENCSFRIQITTREESSVRLNENMCQAHFPWIEADREDEVEGNLRILPIKTMETSLLKLNMYIES